MPRPKNKEELIKASDDHFKKLWEIIDSLTETEFSTPFDFPTELKQKEAHWQRDKNIRDVLVHLYEWHKLLLHWIEKNTNGEMVPFLPEPYTWKTYGEMNIEFWKQHQTTSYEKSVQMVNKSHNEVMECIQKFSDEELFTKKYFSWTGTTSLGSYCISATSSHYDWAFKKIKKHKKFLQK